MGRHGSIYVYAVLAVALVTAAGQRSATPRTPAPTYRISGTVVNALTGQALDKTEVTIGRAMGNDVAQGMTTGEDGRFEFEVHTAEKFWLRAQRKGFALQAYEEHEGFFTGIATGSSFDTEHLIFRVRPDASIVGTVLDEGDEPVRNAPVTLFRRQIQDGTPATNQQMQVITNDEGRYRFSHLLPGTYFVMVEAQPWYAQGEQRMFTLDGGTDGGQVVSNDSEPSRAGNEQRSALEVAYPITFYSGATDATAATPIVLNTGDQATADIRLSAVPAPRLRVHHPDMKPSEPWNVTLTQRGLDNDEIAVQAQIYGGVREGEIELRQVPPGDYELKAQNYGKNPRTWTQSVSIRGDSDVSLTDEEAPAPVSVHGTIRIEGGEPVNQGYVQLWNRTTGDRMAGQTSEKGEFEIPPQAVAAGSYEVSAGGVQGALVSRISAKGAKVSGENVVLGGAGAVELNVTLQKGLGRVDGVVLQAGKAVSGAMVVLVPPDPPNQASLIRRDQSDLDGTFSLYNVLPGTYTVVALRDAWDLDWMSPDLLARVVKSGEKIEVAPKGKLAVKVNVQDAAAPEGH